MKRNDEIGKVTKRRNNKDGEPAIQQRILVAEDDDSITDVFRIIFEEAGYITDILSNGFDLMQHKFTVPDLFLIDKNLPGSNGLDICLFLKSQEDTRHIPVILISAAPDIGTLSKAAKADAYVSKPFDIARHLTLVKHYINA